MQRPQDVRLRLALGGVLRLEDRVVHLEFLVVCLKPPHPLLEPFQGEVLAHLLNDMVPLFHQPGRTPPGQARPRPSACLPASREGEGSPAVHVQERPLAVGGEFTRDGLFLLRPIRALLRWVPRRGRFGTLAAGGRAAVRTCIINLATRQLYLGRLFVLFAHGLQRLLRQLFELVRLVLLNPRGSRHLSVRTAAWNSSCLSSGLGGAALNGGEAACGGSSAAVCSGADGLCRLCNCNDCCLRGGFRSCGGLCLGGGPCGDGGDRLANFPSARGSRHLQPPPIRQGQAI
mmetsp:Transcript_15805/g.49683  ORF Transcript_15805/g.49683 Transcript_15805/m.49683 type:complete len:288 (+) Transcript_15805:1092-1955(+)